MATEVSRPVDPSYDPFHSALGINTHWPALRKQSNHVFDFFISNNMQKVLKNTPKIIVILGPTATGKSDLAVKIALKHNGEIISADSRQVYTGLNIGTGKITKKEMCGIPHHMLDVVSPQKIFSVAEWQLQTKKKIQNILERNKLPIICGGTGFYIQSIVDNIVLPEVPPDTKLREKLKNKSPEYLFSLLKKIDPERAETVEKQNPVRLIRAIEIATALGQVPKLRTASETPHYDFLQTGLTLPEDVLRKNIEKRCLSRMKKGMVAEAKKLHARGLSWKRMHSLGLEYRYLSEYLQKKISKAELIAHIQTGNWQYAKRQMTWFKRDARVHWVDASSSKASKKIFKKVSLFIR